MTVASADTPNNSSSVAWCQRINWSRPPKRSANALSNAGGNVVDSANAGHGAIARFSNSVVVRDHVNANAASGSASASANNDRDDAIARRMHRRRGRRYRRQRQGIVDRGHQKRK